MKKSTISILGCGWLGFPLAQRLLLDGYDVKGSTTSENKLSTLQQAGINPYRINLTPEVNPAGDPEFFNSEILVVNIPPPKVENKVGYHIRQIESILEYGKKQNVKNILFVSSTSVYPNCNCKVTEELPSEPESNSGEALMEPEKSFLNNQAFNSTVLRCAGLVGKDGNPVKYLVNKKSLKDGRTPVNLIYLDDCINLIEGIVIKKLWNEVFNACSEKHPSRKDYYTGAAKKLSLEPPEFSEDREPAFKIISSDKIKEKLNYTFVYPDPLDFP